MHLDEEQVQRLLHGELVPRAASSVREHLTGCSECRAWVAETEREEQEVQALLRHLDHAVPRVDVHAVARRARAHELHWGRWAAGVALALGLGGASYAIPGSPLPAWVRAAAQWVGGWTERSPSAPAPTSPPEPEPTRQPEPSVAGIAVAPGPALLISFTSAAGQVRVSLTDAAQVVVRAPSGAAVFTSHVDQLVIDNAGSTTTFDIEIPRTAPRVEIRAGKQRILLKEGGSITAAKPAESSGPYLLPLTPSGP